MSTRKSHPRNRALRPSAEGLEGRQLLSATVSGTDIDGDQWTLRLVGPGSLTVSKQNDASGNPTSLTSASEIKTITVGGTDPKTSRLLGTITKGPSGDGKVFFQNLNELENHSLVLQGNGLLSISMPNFWLGNTTPVSSTATTTPTPPDIRIPDGVDSFVFAGVDTTHNQNPSPPSTATSDNTHIELGLPQYGGTRIVIDQSISSSQTVPPAAGSSTTTPTTIQHAVTFEVSGRLDLFQANTIVGDAKHPPGQFSTNTPGATGFGGTWVVSGTGGSPTLLPPFFQDGQLTGTVTGQIGDLRIGGNATNFSTLVFDATGSSGAKISNFSIGGETNNVLLVAPTGARNLYFGKGMDTVDVRSHVINQIQANRGALNSTVASDRTISRLQFGGDVVNTQILSGAQQNFGDIISTVTGQKTVQPPPFSSPAAPAPAPFPTNAQIGGGMTVLVAGDVTNSVFVASVQPGVITPGTATAPTTFEFGTPLDLVLPGGHITAKVEGAIDNTIAAPSAPTKAFFAQNVQLKKGPVIPPSVPEEPFSGPSRPTHIPGLTIVRPIRKTSAPVVHAPSVPKGPAKA